jgi:plasmid stabilization system protein ParE
MRLDVSSSMRSPIMRRLAGGLGQRFKDEVDRCILWSADHPELYRLRARSNRRVNLRGFRYYIPYIVREDTLWILAVAHASRKPRYWISRSDEAV